MEQTLIKLTTFRSLSHVIICGLPCLKLSHRAFQSQLKNFKTKTCKLSCKSWQSITCKPIAANIIVYDNLSVFRPFNHTGLTSWDFGLSPKITLCLNAWVLSIWIDQEKATETDIYDGAYVKILRPMKTWESVQFIFLGSWAENGQMSSSWIRG